MESIIKYLLHNFISSFLNVNMGFCPITPHVHSCLNVSMIGHWQFTTHIMLMWYTSILVKLSTAFATLN